MEPDKQTAADILNIIKWYVSGINEIICDTKETKWELV